MFCFFVVSHDLRWAAPVAMSAFLLSCVFFLLLKLLFPVRWQKEQLSGRKTTWQKRGREHEMEGGTGERYPKEETRDVPEAKDRGIKASLRVSLKGAL